MVSIGAIHLRTFKARFARCDPSSVTKVNTNHASIPIKRHTFPESPRDNMSYKDVATPDPKLI